MLECSRIHAADLVSGHREVLSPVRSSSEALHQWFIPLEHLVRIVLRLRADVADVAALRRTEQGVVLRDEADFYRKSGVEVSFFQDVA